MAAPPELHEIGRGTFGRVYKAFDPASSTYVAVKELLEPSTELERFVREISMLAEHGKNPNVVKILSWDISTPRPYFVMEYCDGGSLANWAGKASWRDTAMMLLHAASGLAGIHAIGGFHRDVKPLNLLLSKLPDGGYIVKVADFGLARRPQTAKPPMTATPGGTPGYMAPELSMPGAQFTVAADIYSLGVCGIELLTGRLSVDALSSIEMPDALRNLLTRMTSIAPWIRPSTADTIIALSQIAGVVPPGITNAPVAPARAPQPSPAAQAPAALRSGGDGGLGLLLLIGGLALGAAGLAAGNRKEWDDNIQRYRGKDGRFRSG